MGSILIKGVTLNGIEQEILIVNNRISKIGLNIECSADRVISGKNRVAIPGFVNMHTHSAMTLMRGIEEDEVLDSWLQKIWNIEPKLDEEMIYWGTKLACLEMIKSGTTTFNDQYWMINSAVNAVEEMGVRSVNAFVFLDLHDKEKAERLKEECQAAYEASKKWGDREIFSIGVHAPYSVSKESIIWASDFAKKHDLLLHIHLSETEAENRECMDKYGVSPTEYLDNLGVLNSNVLAAHCIWLSDNDIEILAKRGVKAVHNINSNLKLASGYKFRYNELRDAGVVVSLGTDGCASSNNLDMLEAMKTTAMVQKAWRGDPTAMPLREVMDSATKNGAQSLKIDAGRIEEGALADILLIDINSAAFVPNINFEANLIYAANSSCVDSVICNGEILMEGRVVEGEQEILDNCNRLYRKLL